MSRLRAAREIETDTGTYSPLRPFPVRLTDDAMLIVILRPAKLIFRIAEQIQQITRRFWRQRDALIHVRDHANAGDQHCRRGRYFRRIAIRVKALKVIEHTVLAGNKGRAVGDE